MLPDRDGKSVCAKNRDAVAAHSPLARRHCSHRAEEPDGWLAMPSRIIRPRLRFSRAPQNGQRLWRRGVSAPRRRPKHRNVDSRPTREQGVGNCSRNGNGHHQPLVLSPGAQDNHCVEWPAAKDDDARSCQRGGMGREMMSANRARPRQSHRKSVATALSGERTREKPRRREHGSTRACRTPSD